MNPTEYHPVRTAMMRNIHDRRFRQAHGENDKNDWSTPRAPTEWKARFGSYAAHKATPKSVWFDWDRLLIADEMGNMSSVQCAAAMDRLCIFEDMLASIRRDRNPIIDLSGSFEAITNDPSTTLVQGRAIDPEFTGSLHIHFGETGIKAIGEKTLTGAYVNAERYPKGTIHGDVHFVAGHPAWERAHEVTFYETLAEHQDSAVVMFKITPSGELSFHMENEDVTFGNENNAYVLLPYVKAGIDVALGKASHLEGDVRTEYFHAGPNVRPQDCRIDVMAVYPKPAAEPDLPRPGN